ncbi:hypothetical protein [Sinomonas cellulolyticus]|uniref:DUF308 domain-containing protein n=1 Tax=Sinomonas cellulolyticus TaxID=2801916 RepID=A0ABS1JXW1_9MICC|nr:MULTISPECIES: hypothetical protein [Sinomonas]MBL0704033.1 hypothetical protein [Sinomonas cellulolyticus]
MPETPSTPPQPATPSPAPAASAPDARRRALAAPVLLRAAVALVFGAITVFWGAPSPIGAASCLAAFFVGLAVARAWLLRREGGASAGGSAPTGLSRAVASAGYGLAAAVGLGLVAAPTGTVLGIGGAVAFALTGAADLATGFRGRGWSPLARDELIAGVVHLGTAVLLPFFAGLGPHAVLGVAGGAAIITGVLLAIAGLSLRHDSAPTAPVA